MIANAARPGRVFAGAITLAAALILGASVARAGDVLAPGDPFPAWTLRDQTGTAVSSSSLAGKRYLLWFYPRAMTPGCTAEAAALRGKYPELREAGVEVVGVSFDQPEANAAFVAGEKLPFRLLSDDGTLAVAVGAATASDQAARRISYLVGADGKVLRVYTSVNPATHAGEVLADANAGGR